MTQTEQAPQRAEAAAPVWHALEPDAVAAALSTSLADGLDSSEAARRLGEHGPNELKTTGGVAPWRLLLEQLRNVLVLILLAAVVVSAVLGHVTEAIVVSVIVLFAVVLGFVQEYRAERALEALRELAAPQATVVRSSEIIDVEARELVPGDLIVLDAGDRVPADARVVESANLQVEESALTGESAPVAKRTEGVGPNAAVADRHDSVFAGTAVTYGRGRALVVATGMETEFGQIAHLLQTIETARTPLQRNLDRVGAILARVGLAVVVAVVGVGLLRGESFVDMLLFGTALAVAVVPEALPAVVTISLTLAAQRMARRNALIRRLPATETLGSVSVIGSDKTGTLTKDEMTARKVVVAGRAYDVSGAGYEPDGELMRDGEPVEPPAEVCRGAAGAALACFRRRSSTAVTRPSARLWSRAPRRPAQGAARRRAAARRRDPLHRRGEADDDSARRRRRRRRLREGGARDHPRLLRETTHGRR